MPIGPKGEKRPADVIGNAVHVMKILTGEIEDTIPDDGKDHDMASRIVNRIQLASDGHKAYLEAVERAFGADIDYAMLNKIYGASSDSAKGRYSPAECVGCRKERIEGSPNMAHVSTSYAERANLTMRMHNRRFTRLTNAFSKKFENHAHMVAIYAVWYNWLRIHKTLRMTPAMAAGLSETVMDWTDIVEAMDADAPAPKRGH